MDSAKEETTPPRHGLNNIRGLPLSVVFKKETIEEVMDYMPQDGDVILVTYPKTGTTWMQYVIQQILTKGEDFPDLIHMMEKVMPFLEMTGTEAVDNLTSNPRVYKHHLPYNMVKNNPKAKIVYVYRKPDDTFISYYHFMNNTIGYMDFEKFYEGFVSGNINYGRYFEHVLSFLEHKDDPNLLMVSYEKLKLNTKDEILRIAKFLGQEYYDAIASDESVLNNILEHTSFDYMKKNLAFMMPVKPSDDPKENFSSKGPRKQVEFFRKGTIGDGKKSLSEDKLKKIREVAEEVLGGTDVLAEWYEN